MNVLLGVYGTQHFPKSYSCPLRLATCLASTLALGLNEGWGFFRPCIKQPMQRAIQALTLGCIM